MSLQTVLAEIEPGWYAAAADEEAVAPALIARARGSRLGERMLARWLVREHAAALLAPTPQRDIGTTAVRWPRARLASLIRDLGVLSMAPAIRGEVARDSVRRLKQALGNSYLLALDPSVWDGRVAAESLMHMGAALKVAMADDSPAHEGLYAQFERQGRAELKQWATEHDHALGEWVTLIHPREDELPTVLPAKQVQLLHEHHLARERAA